VQVIIAEPTSVLLVDSAAVIYLVNPASLRLLGASHAMELLGQQLYTYLAPDHADGLMADLQSILHAHRYSIRRDSVWRRIDGTHISATVEMQSFGQMAQPLVQIIIRDATQQQYEEAALRRQAQRFRDLFAHSPDAILVVTASGIIREANPAACQLIGRTVENLIGQPAAELILPDQRAHIADGFMQMVNGTVDRLEWFYARADGRNIPVEVRASRIVDADAPALLLHIRDISNRRRLEAQLLQAQKLESIGRLASGVAHDFNNLLTVILGTAQHAQEQLLPDAPPQQALHEIQRVVNRAARLTRQLLAFARQHSMIPQMVELNELIRDLDHLLQHLLLRDAMSLTTVLAPTGVWISADPGQIEQVLLNLVANACDAMPDGGVIQIETHVLDADDPHVRQQLGTTPYGAVCLCITDTGTGMDSTTLQHLFEPFFTTKPRGQGSGLGLATCYGIVRQHGGQITVDSRIGRGSTFRIYLPLIHSEGS
jgi:two-component system cell cycle sensor histidine kinase/response regulator CckA